MSAFARLRDAPETPLVDSEGYLPTYDNSLDEIEENGPCNGAPMPFQPESSTSSLIVSQFNQRRFKYIPRATNRIEGKNYVLFALKCHEFIVIKGQALLTVVQGAVTINEAADILAGNRKYPIIATQSQALPMITAIDSTEAAISSDGMEEFSQFQDQEFVTFLRLDNYSSGIETISSYYPPLKRFIYRSDLEDQMGQTYQDQALSRSNKYTFDLELNEPGLWIDKLWTELMMKIVQETGSEYTFPEPHITMVVGNKNSGKSTFTKTLLNYYQELIYIDLDPGQLEFSPPHCLSLCKISDIIIGMGVKEPEKSVYYGFNTPQANPTLYIKCIEELLRHYMLQMRPQGHSLIVNTPGWIKGFGKVLLEQITALLHPDTLVVLGGAGVGTNDLLDGLTYKNSTILPGSYQASMYSPAQLRTYGKLAYFHRKIGVDGDIKFDFNRHILDKAPTRLSFQTLIDDLDFLGINAISVLNFDPRDLFTATDVYLILESTIVAVLLVSNEEFQMVSKEETDGGPLILGSDAYEEIFPLATFGGLAMVHSINRRESYVNLYFHDCSEAKRLAQEGYKIILARGDGEIASPEILKPLLIQDQRKSLKKSKRSADPFLKMPYVSFEGSSAVGGVWKVRRNVMRRSHQ